VITRGTEGKEDESVAKPAVARFEVTGKDGPALQTFYGALFDWRFQDAGQHAAALAASAAATEDE